MILDASAILALLFNEQGAEDVERSLPVALVSSVNLSEVASKLNDKGLNESAVRRAIFDLKLRVVDFDRDLALDTGLLRASTKALGLSFGDRACLATARRLRLAALTAEQAWAELDLGVEVRLIR